MQDTGSLGLVHWDNSEGWYGEGGGRGVQDWEQRLLHLKFKAGEEEALNPKHFHPNATIKRGT